VEPPEPDPDGDEFDLDDESALSRSQKRRLRRKRKRARERDDDGVEGGDETPGRSEPQTDDDRPEPRAAIAAQADEEPARPAVEPEAETIVDPLVAPVATGPTDDGPPPGESLAPPASDGVFGSLKRYLGLGSSSGRGSSDS
jgi:hypothetical protein